MSGDWIKMRVNLWDDPRIGRICDLTGVRESTAIGALYWLWATADQHTSDGCMPGLSMQQIDRKTGVKGFSAALVDIGWLADDPQGVVVRHFEEHNGASAKKRAQTAKRVSNLRAGNAEETLDSSICNAASVTQALARDREEKRREEIHPQPPKGGNTERPKAVGLKAWLEAVRKAGEKPVPDDDPVFAYAQQVALPREFLALAWGAFKHRYLTQHPAKRYTDWRRVFRNAVEGNWLKLWWLDPATQTYGLTTVGLQAQRSQHPKDAA